MAIDGVQHSDSHETVAVYSSRALTKSYAIDIISLDIGNELQSQGKEPLKMSAPLSFKELETCIKDQEKLHELFMEASPTPYSPGLYDNLLQSLKGSFEGLDLEQLRTCG